jgi:hypothetical protein
VADGSGRLQAASVVDKAACTVLAHRFPGRGPGRSGGASGLRLCCLWLRLCFVGVRFVFCSEQDSVGVETSPESRPQGPLAQHDNPRLGDGSGRAKGLRSYVFVALLFGLSSVFASDYQSCLLEVA